MAAYETYETEAVYDEMDNNPTVKKVSFYLFSNLISIERHLSQRPRVRKKHHHLHRERMKMAIARYIRIDESFLL